MAEQAEVVNEPVVPLDTTSTDSTPVETTSPEVAEPDLFEQGFDEDLPPENPRETEKKQVESKTDEIEEDTAEPVDPLEEEKPRGKAEERIEQLNTDIEEAKQQLGIDPNVQIRDLVAARNAIRAQVEKANADAYQVQTDQDLLGQINPETGDYYNPLEAKVAAMQQSQEISAYNNQVAEAQLTLSSEAVRAVTEFPMFDEKSPQYNATIAKQADAILQSNLVYDQNTGQIIGSHTSPYQLYKTIADTARVSAENAQIQGQRATETMLKNADETANAPVKVLKKDEFMQGFDTDDF
jgi:hypothetical protein